jgi:hypothetical protein
MRGCREQGDALFCMALLHDNLENRDQANALYIKYAAHTPHPHPHPPRLLCCAVACGVVWRVACDVLCKRWAAER